MNFSDGGQFVAREAAVAHALELVRQGADILDVGGESTRPGSQPVPQDEELRRVLPVVAELAKRIDVDGPAFLDTIERYNKAFAYGLKNEPEFGKPLKGSKPFDTPPFYAVQIFLMARKNFGGVKTDLQCRVLDKHFEPIAGLYAAGEVAGMAGGHINGRAGLEGENPIQIRGAARDDQDRNVLGVGVLANRAAHGEARLVAQEHVEHDGIGAGIAQALVRLARARRFEQRESRGGQTARQLRTAGGIRIDDENPLPGYRKCRAEIDGRRTLSDAAFLIDQSDNPTQWLS